MKQLFSLILILSISGFRSQNQEVPLGVKLTPHFQPPPIAVANFSAKFPGATPEWKERGEYYAARYADNDNKMQREILFDRNGNIVASAEQLQKNDYPKPIDQFFARNYPEEKYEVWRQTDSTGQQEFSGILRDTFWFNKDGKYVWLRNNRNHTLPETDLEFLRQAATSQIMDQSLAQLALVNGHSPEVKAAAAKRSENNSVMHQRLRTLTAQKHLSLPTELNKQQQKKYEEFSQIQGTDFDKAYVEFLVKEDKRTKTLFNRSMKNAQDIDLKNWICSAKGLVEDNRLVAKEAYCAVK